MFHTRSNYPNENLDSPVLYDASVVLYWSVNQPHKPKQQSHKDA